MSRVLQGLITIERSMQTAAVIGVMIFLGYLGITNLKSSSTPVSHPSPTLQK